MAGTAPFLQRASADRTEVNDMNVEKLTKKVPSSDGSHTLSGVVYRPEGEIKGLFHVVHGMQEYIGRYDKFMRAMAQEGYLVFGYDHLGHGKTVNSDSELGFIAHEDGWRLLVDDVDVFAGAVRKEYGDNLPFILFGHSMGSFVVRLAALRFNNYNKLIVMGTGGPNPAAGAGIALMKIIKTFKGERHVSKTAQKLAFGSYNDRFEGETAHDWLSVDRENIKRYESDKYCTFHFTVSAMEDLLKLVKNSNSARWFSGLDKEKPVLLIAGGDDPVGDYGRGVRTVYDKLKKEGANVSLKLYDGYRHEILNEKCFPEVVREIKAFVCE